ncbi:hypothetical protein EVAR_19777_1 [Eumeta japonica]|uniref:Uncharacterized protein n=1 Tax=Eumeta variegata TaxID=151549 RepID=A0A4C1UQM1_EUMVA|nr:hypothetical protein EVAR_19777_1 [Eumeta japonica]
MNSSIASENKNFSTIVNSPAIFLKRLFKNNFYEAAWQSVGAIGLRSLPWPACGAGGRDREPLHSIGASNVFEREFLTTCTTCTRSTGRMRTGKRNRYRQPDSPNPNPKSKRDDISKIS